MLWLSARPFAFPFSASWVLASLAASSVIEASLGTRRLYGRVGGARRKMAAPAEAAESQASGGPRPPVCLLVLGMAGSGKTTFVQVTYTARA